MSECDYTRPRWCCHCKQQATWSIELLVGSMMHPHSGIIHWVRKSHVYEYDVNYISACGLWWVHWWDERRTELKPLEAAV